MVVTVEIRGGPTVRLDYDPARGGSDIFSCTRITLRSEIPPRAQQWLWYLLIDAWGLLCTYAVNQEDWPADLGPAARQPPAAPT